ncbi:triose-phosphate isomerase [Extibacter muris]|uniref:triose-phosphate isomerase n=1 Tax=Extibacter muris TaxID=1796622 RepID=UPI001D071BB5|nr:triose-phosphate isomerase [Extibacter muris]MCB6202487.1 triose-phosphate isomerase [Extibacter muris]MCQ4664356.1 triose-phosphate isomerase [Extibacter muris]MCQ4693565.1 triose-phosphate isomerase [Extibacter muris]
MQKKLYFGSNLKMYKNIYDTVEYLQNLVEYTKDLSRDEIELFIIPSYTTLDSAVKSVDRTYVKIGAQNMCWEDEGQFTGEVSPLMLKEIGIDLVMIGHSERRHVFGETDIEENKKVKAALNHGFTTLLCIGETAEEKSYGISPEVLRTQLKIGFHDIPVLQIPNIWVAYEPVWSIGVNGTPATADYAEEMHKVIKQTLLDIFGDAGADIPVLYGGSVNPGNASELIVQPSIDGLFTGRAAWQADKFDKLIRDAKTAFESK